MQGRYQGTQGRKMRQTVKTTQMTGRGIPRAAVPGLFPVLPLSPLPPFWSPAPSTLGARRKRELYDSLPPRFPASCLRILIDTPAIRIAFNPLKTRAERISNRHYSGPLLGSQATHGLTVLHASHRMNSGKISELAARRRSPITNHQSPITSYQSRITSHDHV